MLETHRSKIEVTWNLANNTDSGNPYLETPHHVNTNWGTLFIKYSQVLIQGKPLSEALNFASTNPQYDDRLFTVHENCKLRIPAEHVVYTNCCFCFVLTFRTILVHNMFCRCCELLKKIYLYFGHFSIPVLTFLNPRI